MKKKNERNTFKELKCTYCTVGCWKKKLLMKKTKQKKRKKKH